MNTLRSSPQVCGPKFQDTESMQDRSVLEVGLNSGDLAIMPSTVRMTQGMDTPNHWSALVNATNTVSVLDFTPRMASARIGVKENCKI